jgi:phosphopentomutase
MELENFAKVKNAIESLKQYSKLDGIKIKTLETKLKSEDKELVNKIFEEDRLKIEQIKETEKQKEQLEKDWNFAISSTNIDTLKNFIEKYPNELEKIGKINQTISKLEDKEKQEKEEKRQKEANEKWLSIKKLESKFMQKALEDFISNYPYFKDIAIVQKELENFSKSSKSSSTNISIDDLANAKDEKR